MRRILSALPLATLLVACDAVTAPYGAALVVTPSEKDYEVTAVALPATVGFLTRYDFEYVIRFQNHGTNVIALDQCDGSLAGVLMFTSTRPGDVAWRMSSQWWEECDTFDQRFLLPGEVMTERFAFSGLSTDEEVLDTFGRPLMMVFSTRAGSVVSPSFRFRPPTEDLGY